MELFESRRKKFLRGFLLLFPVLLLILPGRLFRKNRMLWKKH